MERGVDFQVDAEPVDGVTCVGDVSLLNCSGFHSFFIFYFLANGHSDFYNIKASGYLRNVHILSEFKCIPDLQSHIRHFLYDQLNPESEVFGMDVNLNLCPEISLTLNVQVYH